MAAPQAEVVRFLLERGGRARNAELLCRFKPFLQPPDPAEQARNRELFKQAINSVASVREEDGLKFVVLKRKYRSPLLGVPQESSLQQPETVVASRSEGSGTEDPLAEGWEKPLQPRGAVFALVTRIDPSGPVPSPQSLSRGGGEPMQKPCMMPVRDLQPPASARDCGNLPASGRPSLPPKSPHVKRRQCDESGSRSPHVKRVSKVMQVTEDSRCTDAVPLDPAEHAWLVKTTSGHWSHHLHGLLLQDVGLAERRDFMSGFTALHWAAKSGNTEMVASVVDVTRKSGSRLNVDLKSHGGYTPLHVAAMHGREDVIFMLVWQYNAKVDLRDYSGRKAFQYLKTGSSLKARVALNDPRASSPMEQTLAIKRNSKVTSSLLGSTSIFLGVVADEVGLHDLTKGLRKAQTLNKLFSSSTAAKRRPRLPGSFPSVTSLTEELDEETEGAMERQRPASAFFSP